jgi:uncharacterized hydrophobic protein (TIGR00271 family)
MPNKERHNLPDARIFLIHDETGDLASLPELAGDKELVLLPWDRRDEPPVAARVLFFLDDDRIRELLISSIDKQWSVGYLPHPEARQATRTAGVKGDLDRIFRHFLEVDPIDADVLTCNDQTVFSSVDIGESLAFRPYDPDRPPKRRDMVFWAMKAMRHLRLRSYKLTTGKDQKIQLAALGIVVMEHTQSSLAGRGFEEALSLSDGRLTLLVLAPRSVVGFFWFLARLLIPIKIKLSKLPESVGMIRSNRVLLEAPRGVDYALDGTAASAKIIDLHILDQRMRLLPGPALEPTEDQRLAKDQVRLGHLPVEATAGRLAGEPLPFFGRASEEEYRDLFVSLRDNASLSSPFLVLMVLSVLLALTGLYANSAPVIIGAMILAPLMSPIISLAMGMARTNASLVRNSLRTLAIGIGSALGCAVLVAWIMPLEKVTPEMQARLTPTLLDLSVAVISGIAGAYAHAKEEVARSLAGVAIAVALVPPLSVAGIGLGWADWSMARGAFLLFFTNLVGISLAAGATFLALGFAPFTLARKGLAFSLLVMAIIVGPLYVAFVNLVEEEEIRRQIPTGEVELAGQPVRLKIIEVRAGEPPLVRVVLAAPEWLNASHVQELKNKIGERLGRAVLVEAQLNLRR